jgi:hypothetical protein
VGVLGREAKVLRLDENGLLQSDDPRVRVYHLQTAKGGKRTPTKPSRIVVHITGGHAKPEPVRYLEGRMRDAGLSAEDRVRLRDEVGKGPIPPALISSLSCEAQVGKDGKPRQASWDFTVGCEGDAVAVVQYNCKLDALYTWHAGQGKARYAKRRAGRAVKNADGITVWDGARFVWPGGVAINPSSLGVENVLRVGETPKPLHLEALAELLRVLVGRYGIREIYGHQELDPLDRPLDPAPTLPLGSVREAALAVIEPHGERPSVA